MGKSSFNRYAEGISYFCLFSVAAKSRESLHLLLIPASRALTEKGQLRSEDLPAKVPFPAQKKQPATNLKLPLRLRIWSFLDGELWELARHPVWQSV